MDLRSVGRLVRERRRAAGLTLSELASRARVGRSTLAALEAGKLDELGYCRVARICAEVDLELEARPIGPGVMPHRHLTDVAGRRLTKAAIDDVITNGNVEAWRALVHEARADGTSRLARRVREVATAAARSDPKARAFALLLPALLRGPEPAGDAR
jgi:transcriptional regulator with XRE-family HTH domain